LQKEVKMQIETYGQQMEVTPALRSYVENRCERLGRHFEGDCTIRVQLGLEKPAHKAEATATLAGRTLHADASGADMYAAIDLLVDKLDRLLVKHKEKQMEQRRSEGLAKSSAFD
jgi:putative sigma-54 modulation protein